MPASATNVTAISAQALHSLALRADGMVVAWGDNSEGETNVPPGLSNVVAIAAGGMHNLALKADGTVVAWGYNASGQCNVPAGLSNVMNIAAGWEHSVALKNDGTLVVWGDSSEGQTNVFLGLSESNIKTIAAGGDHSLALVYSSLVQYPIDVTKDLLVLYNTNSTDSSSVLNYYLQNRPGVSNANVLGIGFAGFYVTNATYYASPPAPSVNYTNVWVYESISPLDFTNLIQTPVLNWLANNPTKRPGYIVLMPDVPSRINPLATSSTNFPFYWMVGPSVGTGLLNSLYRWNPMVTHINMYTAVRILVAEYQLVASCIF